MTELERIKKYCDEAKKHNEWEYFDSQARTDLPRCVEALEVAMGYIGACLSNEQWPNHRRKHQ